MRRSVVLLCAASACAVEPSSVEQAVTNGALDTGDPAVVALVDLGDRGGCTATLIGPHTAITAAHCFLGPSARTLRVFMGTSLAEGGMFSAVSDARSHPSFDATTLANDVAVFTFRDELPAAPVALDARTLDASFVGTTFTAVGFGTTSSATADTGEKRAGTARISAVSADEITVTPDPAQPCRGDSGGPMLLAPDAIAAVVSRGDSACSDHAIYARIDVARAVLVDPYVAETAPGTVHTGDRCLYAGHCAEGACLKAHDDPLLYFCSQPCTREADCPAAMECAADGCRYPEPSPGALGSPCVEDAQCTSGMCRDSLCTQSCLSASDDCPEGFVCGGTVPALHCVPAAGGGCGGCSSGGGGAAATLWLLVIGCARARRSGRSSPRRGSRAARAGAARETRKGS
jgi:hypothetical protein